MSGRAALLLGALCLPLLLGACGKRGDPRPPDGEKALYTWPQVYPRPDAAVADEPAPPPVPDAEELPPGSRGAPDQGPKADRALSGPAAPLGDPTRTEVTVY